MMILLDSGVKLFPYDCERSSCKSPCVLSFRTYTWLSFPCVCSQQLYNPRNGTPTDHVILASQSDGCGNNQSIYFPSTNSRVVLTAYHLSVFRHNNFHLQFNLELRNNMCKASTNRQDTYGLQKHFFCLNTVCISYSNECIHVPKTDLNDTLFISWFTKCILWQSSLSMSKYSACKLQHVQN